MRAPRHSRARRRARRSPAARSRAPASSSSSTPATSRSIACRSSPATTAATSPTASTSSPPPTLDVVAQLPDESTTVTFEVTAYAAARRRPRQLSVADRRHRAPPGADLDHAPAGGGGDATASPAPPDLAGTRRALDPPAGRAAAVGRRHPRPVGQLGHRRLRRRHRHRRRQRLPLDRPRHHLDAAARRQRHRRSQRRHRHPSADVFLVGDNATILHGSGTTWTRADQPRRRRHAPPRRVRRRAEDIYVAGGGNTIMHSGAGGGWVTQTVVGTTELRGLWGVAGHLWAVGSARHHPEVDRQRHAGAPRPAARRTSCAPSSAPAPPTSGSSATASSCTPTAAARWTAAADGVPTDVSLRALGGRPGGPGVGRRQRLDHRCAATPARRLGRRADRPPRRRSRRRRAAGAVRAVARRRLRRRRRPDPPAPPVTPRATRTRDSCIAGVQVARAASARPSLPTLRHAVC